LPAGVEGRAGGAGAEQQRKEGPHADRWTSFRMAEKMVDVVLSYQDSSFKIYIDLDDPASLFFTQVYLATNVWPPRQKITGFYASDGQVTISPLMPDANMRQLRIEKGMTLTLEA
jgi:hypothetical protein